MMGDAAVTKRIKTYPIIEKLKQEWVTDRQPALCCPPQAKSSSLLGNLTSVLYLEFSLNSQQYLINKINLNLGGGAHL